MYIESIELTNFRCFGETSVKFSMESDITVLIGNNGVGKTAVSVALQRLFGITTDERTVRVDDFHVPQGEIDAPESRSMSVDVVLAFPELKDQAASLLSVPGFFRHMSTNVDGDFKCRIRLEATWTADSTVDGAIETRLMAVKSLESDYEEDQIQPITNAERSRVQFVYVPAARDGARQVTTFLRGRIWRAAKWSEGLKEYIRDSASEISKRFQEENATSLVETKFSKRWQELQGAGLHATPRFSPVEADADQMLRNAELKFEPDPSVVARPARLLSDGQRSLLHLALTAATLDIEVELLAVADSPFEDAAGMLPLLTILCVEEPENNLAPFYLSRIIGQLLELGGHSQIQSVLSTHSASSLTRIEPDKVRFFRRDEALGVSTVRPLVLPKAEDDAAKYVREAVRAHPELYFSRFVVLGEGDSEQIVLPAIGRAMKFDFDPSFIAMVPLGGRHTQHFWKLLTDLGIPHATLLDMDYGRAGGGRARVIEAVKNLLDVGVDVLGPIGVEIEDLSARSNLKSVLKALREVGVFFSTPLDLDMTMFKAYEEVYKMLPEGARGPEDSDARQSVIGVGGTEKAREYWEATGRPDDLRWYRYLFSNRSKPATHLRAISRLDEQQLAKPPAPLGELVRFATSRIELS